MWLAWLGCTGGTGSATEEVTFYGDVQPLLAESCARCHTSAGFGGTGDFLDYDVARTWAAVMLDRIDAGEMPPPAADPSCHPYHDASFYQVDPDLPVTLAAWIEQGLPAGEAGPALTIAEPVRLPRRDLELIAPGPVTPEFTDGNDYRCFLLGTVEEPTYITGMELLVDHPEISHHALLFSDPNGGNAGKVTDPASASWPCSVTDLPGEMIHAWAPSNGAAILPEGTGIFVPAGTEIVLQMHYFEGTVGIDGDQPGYALTTAPAAQRLFFLPMGPVSFTIPAGAAAHTETFEISLAPYAGGGLLSLDVWAVFPHMHLLGTAYDFHTKSADGEKCLSRADEYDFSMQPTYWFEEPVNVEGNDTLSISCTWDNSADNPLQPSDPPVDVQWGENTQDEMCYGFFYVTVAF